MTCRPLLSVLSWSVGTALQMTLGLGAIVIRAGGRDPVRVAAPGLIRLPAELRRRYRIEVGQSVLLVADRPKQALVVVPATTIHEWMAAALLPIGGAS